MDALTFLRQDHKSVLGMLEVLDEAPSGFGAEISGFGNDGDQSGDRRVAA